MAQIDVRNLPEPTFIEQKSWESVSKEILAELKKRRPELELFPADPIMDVIDAWAYREVLLRAQMQHAALQSLPAYAKGRNLDAVLALFGERYAGEGDEEFLERVLGSPDAYSTAGSGPAYRHHAREAGPEVKDVVAFRSHPNTIRVVVLGRGRDGTPSEATLKAVREAVTNENVRPLADDIEIAPAAVRYYKVEHIIIHVPPGPDPSAIVEGAKVELGRYTEERHKIGADVSYSGVFRALHVSVAGRVSDVIRAEATLVEYRRVESPNKPPEYDPIGSIPKDGEARLKVTRGQAAFCLGFSDPEIRVETAEGEEEA